MSSDPFGLNDFANSLYRCYIGCNSSQLLQTAKELYNLGCQDELRPEFYSHQAEQYGAGNPWIPWNNPTDTLLNEVRVGTYFDDSLKEITEIGERFKEYYRKKNFLWAYIFLYKVNQIEPSNQEVIKYMDLILPKVNLSRINILRNAYAMFKDLGLQQWAQVCEELLNNNTRRSSLDDNESVLKESDKVLITNPNDITALIVKGIAIFNLARQDANSVSKMTKYREAEGYLKRAVAIMSSNTNPANPQTIIQYLEKIKMVTSTLSSMYEDMTKIRSTLNTHDTTTLDDAAREYERT